MVMEHGLDDVVGINEADVEALMHPAIGALLCVRKNIQLRLDYLS